jgi:hypothetical protein
MYSKSLLTGKEYLMPQGSDDRTNIESFLKRNQGKPVIAVQGLGFVGSVMALVCANAHGANYSVIGVDRLSPESFWRIASLNEGTFPLIAEDPKIIEFFGRARAKGNFLATYDPLAYEKADIIIVDVNLDVGKEVGERGDLRGFDVSLNGFRAAIRSIGEMQGRRPGDRGDHGSAGNVPEGRMARAGGMHAVARHGHEQAARSAFVRESDAGT